MRIGVTQIVDHPALNAVRDGFIDTLETEYGYVRGEDVSYDLQNAQGDMATANIIAQKFASERPDLILTIATPTSQAVINAITDIPIVFSAVTDPVAAGLVQSLDCPGANVTGISDLTPVDRQFEFIGFLVPNAKNIGTLYNAAEINSVTTNDLALAACERFGWNLVEATVSTSADIVLAAQSLVGRVDAIYVSTDNTVVSALDGLIQVTMANGIPLILADPTTVEKGALAGLGFNYYQHGQQAADMGARVLQGEDPAGIAVQFAQNLELWFNIDVAQKLDVPLSELLNRLVEFSEDLKARGMNVRLRYL